MSDLSVTRWKVRECEECGIIWPAAEDCCLRCAGDLSNPFEVLRAKGARSADPATSKAAAESFAATPKADSQRGQILEAYRKHGPMTADQAQERTGIEGAWKRISELVQGGHLLVLNEIRGQKGTVVQLYSVPARTVCQYADVDDPMHVCPRQRKHLEAAPCSSCIHPDLEGSLW